MDARRAALSCCVVATLAAGCSSGSTPVATPLDLKAAGPTVCGGFIPASVAETMAGTKAVTYGGTLVKNDVISCTVFRGSGDKAQVFHVNLMPEVISPAANAYKQVSQRASVSGGHLLPVSLGYGYVQAGGDGTEGHNANGITASGDVQIYVAVWKDAKGRDPVADAQSLLALLGPQLMPDWPKPPPGIDPSRPTSPPTATGSAG